MGQTLKVGLYNDLEMRRVEADSNGLPYGEGQVLLLI